MSPQAAAVSSSAQSHRVSLVESDNSFISSLIEAADEAYQKTSDEFTSSATAQVHAGPGRLTTTATTGGRPRFNLRKRKAVAVSVNTGTSCAGSLSAVNSAFLSGLFADLQQTANTSTTAATATNHDAYDDEEEHYVTDGESCPGTPVPSPKKRARLGCSRSLSRCTKSYASLSALASATYNSTDSYVDENFSDQTDMAPSAGTAQGEPTDDEQPTAAPTVSAATSTTSTASALTSTVASDVLADSLSAAAALADAIFPHLPATVSESPLRKTSSSSSSDSSDNSADLTAQPASSTEASIEAGATTLHFEPEKELTLEEVFAPTADGVEGPASAAVTPTDEDPEVSGEGEDSYGWFLALDHDVDASEEHITDAYKNGNESSSAALAFQAPVSAAAGCAAHDAEVEWAKAADTVDDVLGDLPF